MGTKVCDGIVVLGKIDTPTALPLPVTAKHRVVKFQEIRRGGKTLKKLYFKLGRYKWKSVEVAFIERGVSTLSANFRRKWASPTNHCWCQKTRVITLSCGIKISAVHCLVLSQSTRMADRRTERQAKLRLPRPR